jgi:hypothetical protein
MPVIAARESGAIVQTLLHDRPVARGRNNEAMQVDLKSIADGIVIDFGR